MYQEATAQGIWINVVDDPGKCSFLFPAVVQRDQVVVGISTSGVFPALAKKIKQKIEQDLPADLGAVSKTLQAARTRVKSTIADPNERKVILHEIVETVFNNSQTVLQDKTKTNTKLTRK